MHCRVTLLRRKGISLLKSQLEQLPPGYLLIADHEGSQKSSNPRSYNRVAWVVADTPSQSARLRLAQPIFDPELIASSEHEWIIRGIELEVVKQGEREVFAEHVQVWLCEPA